MAHPSKVSGITRRNWWIDLGLFTSAVLAALSGIYFLFLPIGGYQGGRNPWYGVKILFTRQNWDLIHTWTGVAMILVAVLHLVLHWHWVENMARRMWKELRGSPSGLSWRGRYNLIINALIALSFILVAVSGVYLLFFPGGRSAVSPVILFSRSGWDLIHTWSGVVMIVGAILHFVIHWKWVTKVSSKMAVSLGTTRNHTIQPGATVQHSGQTH
ncbi:MAG: DUF4405 domain-containing protein [Anaerolineales bacterium]|nr:DUF4405 domain-containing protein [Anaerolineales bacterium]